MSTFLNDIKYSIRVMRRNPGGMYLLSLILYYPMSLIAQIIP